MKSPALDKSVIRALYDDDADRYDQPALTDYLNRFIAYIHQNDTYGFRLRDDQPYDICKKAAVVNKMERFEISVSPFSVWCKNENRREFTDVVFDTSDKKYPPTTLNLFCGYKAKMLHQLNFPLGLQNKTPKGRQFKITKLPGIWNTIRRRVYFSFECIANKQKR